MSGERLPPHSAEAEAGLLGAILRDNAAFDDVRPLVSEGDFYLDANRKVFAAIAAECGAGKPCDLVILFQRLKAEGQVEDVGGASRLADLWDAVPTAMNAVYHAGIVRDMAARRRLIHLCGEMARDAYDTGEPAEQVVARFESQVFEVGEGARADEPVALSVAIDDVFADLDAKVRGERGRVVSTGLAGLDNVTGGLHPNRLVIVAARPSVGKSAIGLQFALAAAGQGVPALVFSLEMGRDEWASRALASVCEVPLNFLVGGQRMDAVTAETLVTASDRARVPVFIDDRSSHSVHTLSAVARRAVRRNRVGLVVIDYLGLIDHDGHKNDTLSTRIANTSRKLKQLARELKIPVVCLAQLNRDVEKRGDGRPMLSDLRDSGAIEQDADDVLMLWPQEIHADPMGKPSPEQEIRVCVEKQRNGPKAVVPLNYTRRFVKFAAMMDVPL